VKRANRQAVVFGPGGSRPATDDELAAMRHRAERHRAEYEAAVDDARRRWAPELQRAAQELLDRGSVQLRLGDKGLTARLTRSWRGDHVLHVLSSGGGEATSRIGRKQRSAAVLLDHLVQEAARA
jgi:hypothetical protein